MSAVRKKPPAMKQKPKDEVNKKAILWIAVAFAVIVIAMTVLLLVNG